MTSLFVWSTATFDKLFEKATSHLLLEPDWESILQICDCICQGDVQPKYVLSCIKKKLYVKNPHEVLNTLQVLESCMKNCGKPFHIEVACRPFMEELKELVKTTTNDNVRSRILQLIQIWAHVFRNEPKYAVQEVFNMLKMEGFKLQILKEGDAMFIADTAPDWADGNCCDRCRTQFTVVQRKHHCRNCGQIFCHKCSSRSCPIPHFGIEKEVRVCEACWEKLNKLHITPVRSMESANAHGTPVQKTPIQSTKRTVHESDSTSNLKISNSAKSDVEGYGREGKFIKLQNKGSKGDVFSGNLENKQFTEEDLQLAIAFSQSEAENKELLLVMKANVEDRGLKDMTPLMEAANAGHIDLVNLLIQHGADVNAQTSQDKKQKGAKAKNQEMNMKSQEMHGTLPSIVCPEGNTPLMFACAAGHEDIVKVLLDAGARVEDHNENGHTPLMEAASAGHVGVAKLLVDRGASINTHSNEFKESALTLACYKGHLEMVRFLLEAGADREHKTDEMHTALMEASMDGHVEVARLLLDSGAQDVSSGNRDHEHEVKIKAEEDLPSDLSHSDDSSNSVTFIASFQKDVPEFMKNVRLDMCDIKNTTKKGESSSGALGKIFIYNIKNFSDEFITNFFSFFGHVKSYQRVTKKNEKRKSKNESGVLFFEKDSSAIKAFKLMDKVIIAGKKLVVRIPDSARSRCLFTTVDNDMKRSLDNFIAEVSHKIIKDGPQITWNQDITIEVMDDKKISNVEQKQLRVVILDAESVAFDHGKEFFSELGVEIAAKHFMDRGHQHIICVVPTCRISKLGPDFMLNTNVKIIESNASGDNIASENAKYACRLAASEKGILISNYEFKPMMIKEENEAFKETVHQRVIGFCFAKDHFMLPIDPGGWRGKHLTELLSIPI